MRHTAAKVYRVLSRQFPEQQLKFVPPGLCLNYEETIQFDGNMDSLIARTFFETFFFLLKSIGLAPNQCACAVVHFHVYVCECLLFLFSSPQPFCTAVLSAIVIMHFCPVCFFCDLPGLKLLQIDGVFPGCEAGVEMADEVAERLQLPTGNGQYFSSSVCRQF